MLDQDNGKIREMLKSREGVRVEAIELGRVRDYLQALDEPADLKGGDIVPPLFLLTLARTRRPQPPKGGGGVKISDECRFLAPVRVGDTITTTTKVTDIESREGKRGKMYIYTTEATYRNQHGEVVGAGITKSIRWGI